MRRGFDFGGEVGAGLAARSELACMSGGQRVRLLKDLRGHLDVAEGEKRGMKAFIAFNEREFNSFGTN